MVIHLYPGVVFGALLALHCIFSSHMAGTHLYLHYLAFWLFEILFLCLRVRDNLYNQRTFKEQTCQI